MRLDNGEIEDLDAKRYLEEVMGVIDQEDQEGTAEDGKKQPNQTIRKERERRQQDRDDSHKQRTNSHSCCSKVILVSLSAIFLTSVCLLAIDYPNGERGESIRNILIESRKSGGIAHLATAAVDGITHLTRSTFNWLATQAAAIHQSLHSAGILELNWSEWMSWCESQLFTCVDTTLAHVQTWRPIISRHFELAGRSCYLYLAHAAHTAENYFPFLQPASPDDSSSKTATSENDGHPKTGAKPSARNDARKNKLPDTSFVEGAKRLPPESGQAAKNVPNAKAPPTKRPNTKKTKLP